MKEIRYSFDIEETKDDTSEDHENNEDLCDRIGNNHDEAFMYEDAVDDLIVDDSEENYDVHNTDTVNADVNTDEIIIKRKVSKKPRNSKKNRNIKLKKALKLFLIILGTVLCITVSPIFAVSNIVINELHYFTKDEICGQIGLYSGVNGIFYNKSKAEKILEESPYISSADISFKLPDTMLISISENRICSYIEYLGSYLYIDRNGCVIDIKKETEESLPIIEGLKFSSFTIKNVIPVENTDAFKAALLVSAAMNKYGVLDDAVSINVSDTENLYAYINNVKVLLGDSGRMEEKIKTMAEAVKKIPDGDRGTLDLTDLSKPIIFKYTT